jgi:hypothetical protein
MKWREYEARLAQAMRAADPVAAVRAFAPDADADGVRMTALLVAKLRFERLLRGSPAADAWFSADPAAFARAFGAYHAAVAPRAFFPRDEAWLFAAWRRAPIPRRRASASCARLRRRWLATKRI